MSRNIITTSATDTLPRSTTSDTPTTHDQPERELGKHVCPLCTAVFATAYNLRRHITSAHNQGRPYECMTCHKAFQRRDVLTRHETKYCRHGRGPLTPLADVVVPTPSTSTHILTPPLPPTSPTESASSFMGVGAGDEERQMFDILPEGLRELYSRHWESIRTHTRGGRAVTTLTVFRDPTNPLPEWDDILLDMFHSQTARFKINYSHSFVLQHKETDEFSFFHASHNNHTVLERPRQISSKPDFLSFLQSLRDHDSLSEVQAQRPNSKYRPVAIPSTSFYVYHMPSFPIGCSLLAEDIPTFIRKNKFIKTLTTDRRYNTPYKDNLCFFRCLALYRDGTGRGVEGATKTFFRQWVTYCYRRHGVRVDTDAFQGVTFEDLRGLEICFRMNIDIFQFTEGPNPVLVPCWRSAYHEHKSHTMRLLLYKQHFMFITDIDRLGHALGCDKCGKLWRQQCQLDRHAIRCTGLGTKSRYVGGVYTPPKSIFHDLRVAGLDVPDNYVYPYRATYDFEVYFDKENVPPQTSATAYVARHVPLSVSVAANVPGFTDPVCFVSHGDPQELVWNMVNYLRRISVAASKLLHDHFRDLFDALDQLYRNELPDPEHPDSLPNQSAETIHHNGRINSLRRRFSSYLNCLPVVGFNSSKYDINVIKPYLFQALNRFLPEWASDEAPASRGRKRKGEAQGQAADGKKRRMDVCVGGEDEGGICPADYGVNFVVKRNNQFLCITTDLLRFLDISNFLAPGFSYQKYLKAYDVAESKSFFPYEYIDGVSRLGETQLPPHSAFYSNLKQRNITDEEYAFCQRVWDTHNMKTLKDFLVHYNNLDVGPFLRALQAQIDVYAGLGIDLLKDGLSVPGITLKYLFRRLNRYTYFSLFNQKQADLHTLLRDNLTGGPSIIFHRFHQKDETYIRQNSQKIVKSVHGFDANALYLSAIMKAMPTGHPIVRRVENRFRAECTDPYGQLAWEWLEYIAFTENRVIHHKFNGRELQFGARRIRVDGYHPPSNTIFQFHGCVWHGHDCHLTRRFECHPYNKKPFSELRDNTADISRYLSHVLGYSLVEMYECEWRAMKVGNRDVRTFVFEHFGPPQRRRKFYTEDSIIRGIEKGAVFGLIKCDITVPSHLRDYFSELQPIFKNTTVTLDDIGPHMQAYAKEHGLFKTPRRMLLGSYFGRDIVLATPLVQWYLQRGLIVSNITLLIEYTPKQCFTEFGESVTSARRAADVDPSKSILAETQKQIGNSSYGRTLTNMARHRRVMYVNPATAGTLVNDIRFRKLTELDDNLVEVELAKANVNWNLPIQIGFFVYQYAKLRLLEFHFDFIDKFIDRADYQLLECDTDSLYMALSAPTLDQIVKPSLREVFYEQWDQWFPAQACHAHKTVFKQTKLEGGHWDTAQCADCRAQQLFDKRTPGLFKTEYTGDGFVGLCSKTYCCQGEGGVKCSSKGLNKTQNDLTMQTYKNVLDEKRCGGGVNRGFRTDGKCMFTYHQQRQSLSYLYVKRIVGEDGITTYPTNC